jgi:predicted nucleic acid-binding protein
MWNGEYEVQSAHVLEIATDSGRSVYDCEFVALARELTVPLVTADKELARAFGSTVRHLSDYLR